MTPGPAGAVHAPAGIDALVERLGSDSVSVRRVAALDLIRIAERGASDPGPAARVAPILTGHLGRESDEKSRIAVIRHLARAAHAPAISVLWSLYADRATPALVAHAAIIAHDTIAAHHRMPA